MSCDPPDGLAAASRKSALSRMQRAGPRALDDHELFALLDIDVDAETLAGAGGLRELLDEPTDRLHEDSLPPGNLERIQAMLELNERWMAARLERSGPPLSLADTKRYLAARFRGRHDEVFACVFLDVHHRILALEELFRGTVNGTTVHPRVVVRRCLVHNAAGLIAAHNHPSGVPHPSEDDRAITKRLVSALALFDVNLFDHIVVGDGECVSFAEKRLLPGHV